jgi:hypothetical protein
VNRTQGGRGSQSSSRLRRLASDASHRHRIPFAALSSDFAHFRCECGRVLQAPEALAGHPVRCPACHAIATVPRLAREIPEVAPIAGAGEADVPELAPIGDETPEVEPIAETPPAEAIPELEPIADAEAAPPPAQSGPATEGDAT